MGETAVASILTLFDDIARNNAKMRQKGEISDIMSQRLLDELDRANSYVKALRDEAVRNRIAWNKEKEEILKDMQIRQERLENEQNLRQASQERLQHLQDIVDFACSVIAEAAAETEGGTPKALSEKAYRQLLRVRSLKETYIGTKTVSRPVRMRSSGASFPDSEDFDSETTSSSGQPTYSGHARPSITRPRSNSLGLSGGEALTQVQSRDPRAVHWGPGTVTSTSTVHLTETSVYPPPPPSLLTAQENSNALLQPSSHNDDTSDSGSIISTRKRASQNSEDSFFGIVANKKPMLCEDHLLNGSTEDITLNGSSRTLVGSGSRLQRNHEFQVKNCTGILQNCYACGKRLNFGKTTMKCRMCNLQIHPDCQHLLAGPCLPPTKLTPSKVNPSNATPIKSLRGQQVTMASPSGPLSARSLRGKGATIESTNTVITSPSSPSSRRLNLEELVPLLEIPKIPFLVIQCVSEIERRGLRQAGLYRVCGSNRQIRDWFSKLLRGKLTVGLSAVEDVHCITGCLKMFLQSLVEPIVTYAQWRRLEDIARTYFPEQENRQFKDSVKAVRPSAFNTVHDDGKCLLSYECIEEVFQCLDCMPQANRDTLAYIMLHLLRVSESPACNMHVDNLCKVLGPTIVGQSAPVVNPMTAIHETDIQIQIMRLLLSVPSKFYEDILDRSGNAEEDNHQLIRSGEGIVHRESFAQPSAAPTTNNSSRIGGSNRFPKQRFFDNFHP